MITRENWVRACEKYVFHIYEIGKLSGYERIERWKAIDHVDFWKISGHSGLRDSSEPYITSLGDKVECDRHKGIIINDIEFLN